METSQQDLPLAAIEERACEHSCGSNCLLA
jgi:hypothetical protein